MLVAIQADSATGGAERRIAAREATRGEGRFLCPECRADVILHQGKQRVAHFAHRPPASCEYGMGETEAHRRCKMALFDQLRAAGVPCEMEKPLEGVRPDLFFLWNGKASCAIEIQRSVLSVEEIAARTARYHALGVFVLWLALFDDRLNEALYAPRPWELWLHAACLGRVYYWRDGLQIQPVSFRPVVRQSAFHTWYVSGDGEPRQSGGERRLKRYRTPVHGAERRLLTDFRPHSLASWQGGGLLLPARRLLLADGG